MTSGPMAVQLVASVVVPGDVAVSIEQTEAIFAGALRDAGLFVKWAAAEFVTPSRR